MCPPPATLALPIFDRELSLSANATARDGGMLAYIGVNGGGLPTSGAFAPAAAQAVNDTFIALVAGQKLTVSDPVRGVIANDMNVYGVQLLTQAANGTVALNANGTFTYTPSGTGYLGLVYILCERYRDGRSVLFRFNGQGNPGRIEHCEQRHYLHRVYIYREHGHLPVH